MESSFTILPEEPVPKHEVLITFDKDQAEIYLGSKPFKVDTSTAMHMLHQRDNMPEGKSWEDLSLQL